ncbi:MAG: OsmC family protein [Flavobacteriales bacterium]|nr:OsmC family protein [Flavobacteriales bacterium]
MATSRIVYNGDLRCSLEHLRSGSVIRSDAPIDNQGLGEDFSPTDLTASSLGACMLTIMGIKARDQGLDIQGARCDVTKTMLDGPRRIGKIRVQIEMPSSVPEDKRKVLEMVAKNCPVALSLSSDIEQQVEFTYI